MNLTEGAPRSPYDALGGITFLRGTFDKMGAHLAGRAGEYTAKAGYSTALFELFGVSADEFEQIVRDNPTDEGVLRALMARKPLSEAEIEAWNQRSMNRTPTDDAGWARHWKMLEDAGFGDRKDIRTMYDRLDLDDGRQVPIGGRAPS